MALPYSNRPIPIPSYSDLASDLAIDLSASYRVTDGMSHVREVTVLFFDENHSVLAIEAVPGSMQVEQEHDIMYDQYMISSPTYPPVREPRLKVKLDCAIRDYRLVRP